MVLTQLVDIFYQVVLTMSEVSLRVSSLQPTCSPVAHEDDGDSLLFYFRCANLCKMLALSYASCNGYFPKYLDHSCNN